MIYRLHIKATDKEVTAIIDTNGKDSYKISYENVSRKEMKDINDFVETLMDFRGRFDDVQEIKLVKHADL